MHEVELPGLVAREEPDLEEREARELLHPVHLGMDNNKAALQMNAAVEAVVQLFPWPVERERDQSSNSSLPGEQIPFRSRRGQGSGVELGDTVSKEGCCSGGDIPR